jgi:hypothetical protein
MPGQDWDSSVQSDCSGPCLWHLVPVPFELEGCTAFIPVIGSGKDSLILVSSKAGKSNPDWDCVDLGSLSMSRRLWSVIRGL